MEKILPVVLIGKTAKTKLIVAANKITFSILFSLKSFKFFKIKTTNIDEIINVTKSPTTPV